MAQMCRAQGLPAPDFVSAPRRFEARFIADPYSDERLRHMGLKERQTRAVRLAREKGSISFAEYSILETGLTRRTLQRDLVELVEKGIFRAIGETKARRYALRS